MGDRARLLVLIGSGEMAPRMSRVHRSVIQRLAGATGDPASVRMAIVDTPYGFQANADALSAGALDYFGRRLGTSASIASLRRSDVDAVEMETALATMHDADAVFSGPGSPSYALTHWSDTQVPALFAQKLEEGGALIAASAAALTFGRLTLPVYEIYKAGADPHWLPGIDVLSAIGIAAAVVPHWDNAEGAGHDTRFCFLGQHRLEVLEEQLPEDVFILGIDEHTALVVDIDQGRASVRGRGGVTIRREGREVYVPNGDEIALSELVSHSTSARRRAGGSAVRGSAEAGDINLARQVVSLEKEAASLSERARLVEPLIVTLLDVRARARAAGDFVAADAIRDRLTGLGIEVTDAADGTTSFRRPLVDR